MEIPNKINRHPITILMVKCSLKRRQARTIPKTNTNGLWAIAIDSSIFLRTCCQRIAYNPKTKTVKPKKKQYFIERNL